MSDRIPPIRDGGWRAILQLNARLGRGEITEDGWHDGIASLLHDAYLEAPTPWGGSGKLGDEADWVAGRQLLTSALTCDGTFLDVGCANGYLMECIQCWASGVGYSIEPYGVDIVADFVERARECLPQWADRLWTANALHWMPPRRFTYVRASLDCVPVNRRYDLVTHLLAEAVEPGGRLILGVSSELSEQRHIEAFLAGHGLNYAGRAEQPHRSTQGVVHRVYWLDA